MNHVYISTYYFTVGDALQTKKEYMSLIFLPQQLFSRSRLIFTLLTTGSYQQPDCRLTIKDQVSIHFLVFHQHTSFPLPVIIKSNLIVDVFLDLMSSLTLVPLPPLHFPPVIPLNVGIIGLFSGPDDFREQQACSAGDGVKLQKRRKGQGWRKSPDPSALRGPPA